MSMHDDAVSLKDMLNHASEAVELLSDTSRDAFRDHRVLQLALTGLVEIVGEAVNRVSGDTQQGLPYYPQNARDRLGRGACCEPEPLRQRLSCGRGETLADSPEEAPNGGAVG